MSVNTIGKSKLIVQASDITGDIIKYHILRHYFKMDSLPLHYGSYINILYYSPTLLHIHLTPSPHTHIGGRLYVDSASS